MDEVRREAEDDGGEDPLCGSENERDEASENHVGGGGGGGVEDVCIDEAIEMSVSCC